MSTNAPQPADWNPRQYLKFEDERTRPPRELLSQVPLERPQLMVDLGCGPGNSTEVLVDRYPEATVIGLDSSSEMLRQTRARLPQYAFIEADLAGWEPPGAVDLLFANAVFQWLPDHQTEMRRLAGLLPEGGVLAVQMPDNTHEPSHRLMEEVARNQVTARFELPGPGSYYDLLKPLCRQVEIWHTVYNHVMAGQEAIVEWFKGSALRPFLSGLSASEAGDFLEAYTVEIARHYPARVDGRVLLRFPRLFIVATK